MHVFTHSSSNGLFRMLKNCIFVTLFASKVYRTQTRLILLQTFDMPEVQLIDLFADKNKCALFQLATVLKDLTNLTQL